MKNFDTEFANLLSTWNHYQELHTNNASISALATSRFDLDAARRSFH